MGWFVVDKKDYTKLSLFLKCEPYPLASQLFYPYAPQFNARDNSIVYNCNNAIIYDFTPAYLKLPLQIRVPHLHKAMSPNVTGDTVDRGSLVGHLSPMRKF
jgi:hypothetical protein